MKTALLSSSSPLFSINGTEAGEAWRAAVVSIRVRRGLGVVGRAVLRFTDPGYALSGSGLVSANSDIRIAVNDGGDLFDGIVTAASLEQSSSQHPELVITADEPWIAASLGTVPRTFLNVTWLDVIRLVASSYGLTVENSRGLSDLNLKANEEWVLQNTSDLALIGRIAERFGAVWWVDGHRLHLSAPDEAVGSATVALGEDLTEFSVRANALRPTSVVAMGLDVNRGSELSPKKDTTVQGVDAAFAASFVQSRPIGKDITQNTFHGIVQSDQTVSSLANGLSAAWKSETVVATGSGPVNAAIKPMASLRVTDAGPSSGTYRVSEVEHIYRRDGFRTRFTTGPNRPSGMVDLLGTSRPDPGFRIDHLVTGVVTDTRDKDNLGRVKVKFQGKVESTWARVLSFGGGDQRGSVFLPEIEDEVLVGFERGDSSRPVVLGGLFSRKATLAADVATLVNSGGKVTHRRITSRSGHKVEFGDGTQQTQQHILLALGDGAGQIRVGSDKLDVTTQRKAITLSTGQGKIEIDPAGNITIEGMSIKLKAQVSVSIEGATIEAKGQAQASVQAAVVEVKAGGAVNVSSSGPLALKGATVAIN